MIRLGNLEYQTTEDGCLIKRRGIGLIKMHPDKDGYLKYHLCQGKRTINLFVHRVIWMVFNGDIPDGLTVDHIDGDKTNNNISNLQLLTAEQNAVKGNARRWCIETPEGYEYIIYNLEEYCRKHGLHAGHMREVAKGYKNVRQHKGYRCYAVD